MGKRGGSAKQQVTDYYMSLHFGIASELDAITGIYVNEKTAWEGNLTAQGDININQPDLFGGVKREGGLVGTVTYLPGNSTQVMPEILAAKFGLTSATMPAFRGTSTVFFHGGAAFTFNPFGFGFGGQTGFQWSSNNPIIAQTVWVRGRRVPKGLDPAKAMIGADANPIHMIFECQTNPDWGMGGAASSFDIAAYEQAASVLFDEQFGLSMIWTRQTEVETFITEVLDHIEATQFIHPRTGLQTIKLIRNDYNPAALAVVNPDNAELDDFQRKFPGEVINEITVTWSNPANEQEETVTVQNIAAIARQGGQIVSDNRNYYGVRSAALANRLALRDLRAASAPIASAKVRLLRQFWDSVPGDVVRLVWPSEGGEPAINAVMRVVNVDYGKIGSPYITASLVEDVFSLSMPPVVTPPSTSWQSGGVAPAPMAVTQVFTLPYYLTSNTAFAVAARDLVFPEVVAAVLASPPNSDTRSFDLRAQITTPAGATAYESLGVKTPVGRTTLVSGLAAEVTTTLAPSNLQSTAALPIINGFVLIGDNESTQELALVTGLSGPNYVLRRGVLDTYPRSWPAGTQVWLLNPGLRVADEQIIRSAGESVTYKLLPTTSLGTLSESAAPPITQTLTARPHRPLRPANVRINGQAFADVAIGASTTINIQWATRNRVFEDGVVLAYDASPVSPEFRQRTIVRVFNDATNALLVEYNHLWTENELVLQRSWFNRFSVIRIEVFSERDGLTSHQAAVRRVTGLANNPGAPLPPAPPLAGDPPAQAAGPGVGVYSLFAETVGAAGTSVYPVLVVEGTQDDPEADSLIARFRKIGESDWTFWPSVSLSRTAVRFEITTVVANTQYEVEVAYLYENGVPSRWRSLGSAITGSASLEWSSVGGTGRPQDGATATAPANANRVRYSLMERDQGWDTNFNPSNLSITEVFGTFNGRRFFAIIANTTGAGQAVVIGQAGAPLGQFSVSPGERLSVQSRIDAFGAVNRWSFSIWFVGADGSRQQVAVADGVGQVFSHSGDPQRGFVTVPAVITATGSPVVSAYLDLGVESAGAGTMQLAFVQPMVTSASAAQTLHPPFSPGPNAADGATVGAPSGTMVGPRPAERVTQTFTGPETPTGAFEGDYWTVPGENRLRRYRNGVWVVEMEFIANTRAPFSVNIPTSEVFQTLGTTTLGVGPNGNSQVTAQFDYSPSPGSGPADGAIELAVFWRPIPGSGAWTQIGSTQIGSTASRGDDVAPGEPGPVTPGSVVITRNVLGPATPSNQEFQVRGRLTGDQLSGTGSATVSWVP